MSTYDPDDFVMLIDGKPIEPAPVHDYSKPCSSCKGTLGEDIGKECVRCGACSLSPFNSIICHGRRKA